MEAGADPSGHGLLRHAFSDEREDYHWDIVRMLVEAGADPNEYNDRTAGTALRRATATGNEEAMLFLIKAGANPDDGLSAAIQSGDAGRLQILFDAGASPDVVAGLGTAFLGQAIREDDAGMVRGMVRTLIEAGADPEFVGLLGGRLLMEAIKWGNVEIVRILVDAGADVEAPGSFSYTPLTLAAIDGKVEIVQILINAGADVNAAGSLRRDAPGGCHERGPHRGHSLAQPGGRGGGAGVHQCGDSSAAPTDAHGPGCLIRLRQRTLQRHRVGRDFHGTGLDHGGGRRKRQGLRRQVHAGVGNHQWGRSGLS